MKSGSLNTLLEVYYACQSWIASLPNVGSKRQPQFHEIRRALLEALEFLAEKEPADFRQLPWRNQDEKGAAPLRIRKNYIRDGWRAYRRGGVTAALAPGHCNRWDILTLYGDYPLPAYMDIDGYVMALAPDIRSEVLAGRHLKDSREISGAHPPGLFDILKKAVQLQCRWSSDTFLVPLPLDAGDGCHESLYGFSGYLIDGLAILAELIRAVKTGVIFRSSYARRLSTRIAGFLTLEPPAPIRFADLLFLHHALSKIWLALSGETVRATGRPGAFQSPVAAGNLGSRRLMEMFQPLFVNNPVSVIIGLDSFSDMGLLARSKAADAESDATEDMEGEDGQRDAVSPNTWDPNHMVRLFQAPVSRQHLYRMADYLYDSLMSPCPPAAATSFGIPTGSQRNLFGSRIDAVVRMFRATVENIQASDKGPPGCILFWIHFFTLLLDEWVSPTPQLKHDNFPLPPLQSPLVPTRLRLSHFSVDAARKEDLAAVQKAEEEGTAFSDLAKRYGHDHAARAFGGEIGWVAADNLPGAVHAAKLLGCKIDVPFSIVMNKQHHYFMVHEIEFAKTHNFFKRVVEQAVRSGGEGFRQTVMALFKALEQLTTGSPLKDPAQADLTALKNLHLKAQIDIDLLNNVQTEQ